MDALTFAGLLDVFAETIRRGSRSLILNQNLHSVYAQLQAPSLRAVYDRADWVYVDGMPIVWLARAAGLALKSEHRVTLLDCFLVMLGEAALRNWRVYYLGGSEIVLQVGLARIRALHPGLEIAGRNGYFLKADSADILAEIHAFQPHLLLVGMGMPLQEEWVGEYYDQLNVPIVTTCGATMSYISGHGYRPPAWAGRLGLYGIFRMLADPKRLWKRYLLEPITIAPCLTTEVIKRRLSRI